MTQSQSPKVTEGPTECPLCMEPLEIDDVNFFPCTCGYQICRFCWHHIRTNENGLCPTCRKPYTEDPAVYKPLSKEELQRIKNEKKQKQNEKKQKITETRKHLSNVRVIQKNLVFVLGLSQRLADPKVLKRPNYFGRFGKITTLKVMTNNTSYAGSQGPIASAYVTYSRSEDALRAIQCVNNEKVDGRILKASLGTTKYCSYFLKSMPCPKPDCTYLHELGDEDATFTKEEIQAGKHEEYKQKLLQDLLKINPTFLQITSATGWDKPKGKSNSLQSSKSTNKVPWLLLTPTDTTADDGLSSEHRKSPPLDGISDSEYVTPNRPDSDLGLISPISPFSSNNCEPTSPNDKLPDIIGIGNGEISQLLLGCDSPSPPSDHTKSSLPVPIGVAGLTARSAFVGAVSESQSLFSDSFMHPNNLPNGLAGFHSSPHNHSDWPTTPEPQSPFNSSSIPVSPSTCLAARSHFDGLAAESQFRFSDIFRQPNPISGSLAGFSSSPQNHSDWPPTPEPQRPFTSDSIPVSSSTDWEAAFGFASSKQQQQQQGDDHSFEELDKQTQKKLSVQDNFPCLSPAPLPASHLHSHPMPSLPTKGGLRPCGGLLPPNYFPPLLPNRFYSSYGFPGYPSSYSPSANSSATHQPWMGVAGPASAHSNLAQLNHTADPTVTGPSHSRFFDLNLLPGHHNTGLVSQVVKPPPGFHTTFRTPGQSQTDLLQSATIDRN